MFSVSEMVATVVLSAIAGTMGGRLGSATRLDDGSYRVEVEAKEGPLCFIVKGTVIGWAVSFGPYKAEDADLENAVYLALSARDGRRAVASRNYAVNL